MHRNHRRDFGMNYAAYNKPASVYYWTRSGQVRVRVRVRVRLLFGFGLGLGLGLG